MSHYMLFDLYSAIIKSVPNDSQGAVTSPDKIVRNLNRVDKALTEAYECIPRSAKNCFVKYDFLPDSDVTERLGSIAESVDKPYNYIVQLYRRSSCVFHDYLDGIGFEWPRPSSPLMTFEHEFSIDEGDEEYADDKDLPKENPFDFGISEPQPLRLSPKYMARKALREMESQRPKVCGATDKELYQMVKKQCIHHNVPTSLTTQITMTILQIVRTGTVSPLLLVGLPGIGKTYLANVISDITGLPVFKISAPDASSGIGLTGFAGSYKDSEMGGIASAMIKTKCVNPIIIIDEIDKAKRSDSHHPIADELLSACDGSRMIHDHFLDIDISTRQVFFILTANDQDSISKWLLDRCEVIDFPKPDLDRILAITISRAEENSKNSLFDSKVFCDKASLIRMVKIMNDKGISSLRQYIAFIDKSFLAAYESLLESDDETITISDEIFESTLEMMSAPSRNNFGFKVS